MSASRGLFQKYPNPVFVETGSLYGDGIQQALDEGFETIYSIEILPEFYKGCILRFIDNLNVHLLLGDSGLLLEKTISKIKEPITFWLDAHKGVSSSPLLRELDIIKRHLIKNHTILIDDLHDCTTEKFGFDIDTLKDKILEINSNYVFILEDGHMSNVLVAKI